MSGVLKGRPGEPAARIRPLWGVPGLAESTPSETDARIAALRSDLDEALSAVAERDERIAKLEADSAKAVRRAGEEGRKLGLEEAESRSAEMLESLEAGISGAADALASGLSDLERLAVLVARESLSRIIGDPALHGELIERIIRAQMEKIEGQAVIAVEVSSANFESGADVAPLLGRSGIAIRISEDLESGDCRIRLRLGTLEVGLGRQWDSVREALDEILGAGA